MVSAETLAKFVAIVGHQGAITEPSEMTPYVTEWRNKWIGKTSLVLRPSSTEHVSEIMKLAFDTNTKIIPQSGHTGLVGGGTPSGAGDEVVLSLNRMSNIIAVDADNNAITVEAGATLKSVQDAARAAQRLFPLSLASEGSARIGGNLATNAGGVNVLAYGNMRELCFGLEVVLADGRIWNGLRALRKDNTGYDLKNMFIGSEGTLGIITRAVLKLYPLPLRYDTALIAVKSPEAAVKLFSLLKSSQLTSCELLPRIGMDFVTFHMGKFNPLPNYDWYVLAEYSDVTEQHLQNVLDHASGAGLVLDAVIASSEAQRQELWTLRESLSESQKFEGGSIKHDIAVPVSRVPQFVAEATQAIAKFMPGARPVPFGHLGDGNLHYNVSQPVGMDSAAYLSRWHEMNDIIHAIVIAHNGSISAEHGIGILKVEDLSKVKSSVELQLMFGLKQMLDPKNILSPGRVLPKF